MNCFVKLIISIIMFGVAIISIENEITKLVEQTKYKKVNLIDDVFQEYFYSEKQLEKIDLYSDECKTVLHNVENDVSYFLLQNPLWISR